MPEDLKPTTPPGAEPPPAPDPIQIEKEVKTALKDHTLMDSKLPDLIAQVYEKGFNAGFEKGVLHQKRTKWFD